MWTPHHPHHPTPSICFQISAMNIQAVLIVVVLLVTDKDICHAYSVGGTDGMGGSCTVNFQVWRPSQDVIKRIENVEHRYISKAHIVGHINSLPFDVCFTLITEQRCSQ